MGGLSFRSRILPAVDSIPPEHVLLPLLPRLQNAEAATVSAHGQQGFKIDGNSFLGFAYIAFDEQVRWVCWCGS